MSTWTLIIMLHSATTALSTKGSIAMPTKDYEECVVIREQIKKDWSDTRYRVSASCVNIKR